MKKKIQSTSLPSHPCLLFCLFPFIPSLNLPLQNNNSASDNIFLHRCFFRLLSVSFCLHGNKEEGRISDLSSRSHMWFLSLFFSLTPILSVNAFFTSSSLRPKVLLHIFPGVEQKKNTRIHTHTGSHPRTDTRNSNAIFLTHTRFFFSQFVLSFRNADSKCYQYSPIVADSLSREYLALQKEGNEDKLRVRARKLRTTRTSGAVVLVMVCGDDNDRRLVDRPPRLLPFLLLTPYQYPSPSPYFFLFSLFHSVPCLSFMPVLPTLCSPFSSFCIVEYI